MTSLSSEQDTVKALLSLNDALGAYASSDTPAALSVVTTPPPSNVILAAALAWQAAGFSVVPVRLDGSKAPLGEWTTAQQAPATAERVRAQFGDGHPGLGVVCGKVSGNLEMLELEGRAVKEGLRVRLRDALRPALWAKLNTYREMSPSGGLHFLYRVEGIDVPGNLKLARRPSTEPELASRRADAFTECAHLSTEERAKRMTRFDTLTGAQVPQVLAETRGEGGQVVVAPSGGPVHESGRPWVIAPGCTPGVVGTLTAAERDEVLAVVRSFDLMPPPRQAEARRSESVPDGEERPGDAFARSTMWHEILEPHDWTTGYREGDTLHWTRPGKRWGTSATTGYGETDLLYVFSSSTVFEPETTYTKFGAYALLNHGGDYAAAAAQLRRDGYGSSGPAKPATPTERLAAAEPPLSVNGEGERPLPLGADPVPRFPVEQLPPTLSEFVAGVAVSTQTPPDAAGLLALGALATAAAGKYCVRLRDDWTLPLNLYELVVLPPGTNKSAVFRSITAPLVQAERDLLAREGPTIRAAEQRHRILAGAAKRAEDAAIKAPDAAKMADAEAADLALAEHVVPPMPRLLVDDVTPEQLVTLLADHRALGLMSDEGGIFETLAGRYGGGVPNLDVVLKAWDGGAIRVDRRGSASRQVEGAALTLALAVQPAVLTAMSKVPDFAGRGLPQRLLYALPDAAAFGANDYDLDPPPVPEDVRRRYAELVSRFALLPRPAQPVTLSLAPGAWPIFQAFRAALRPRRHPDTGDLASITEWVDKLAGQTARLAGLIHLARGGQLGTITEQDMAGAVALAEYAIPHAKAAHDLMAGRASNGAAESLLRVIKAKALREFSVRRLHRLVAGQTRFQQVAGVEAALVTLVETGHVRPVEMPKREGAGRPRSPRFTVSPFVVPAEGGQP
jgi:replicative DNA helicase